MPRYLITGDFLLAFAVEVEAKSKREAIKKVENMRLSELDAQETGHGDVSVQSVEELL